MPKKTFINVMLKTNVFSSFPALSVQVDTSTVKKRGIRYHYASTNSKLDFVEFSSVMVISMKCEQHNH